MSLDWFEHRYGGHTAPTREGGHYLVQADHIIALSGIREETRYSAQLIRYRKPQVWLGYHRTVTDAKQVCELHNRSRWDEDKEAGAIG